MKIILQLSLLLIASMAIAQSNMDIALTTTVQNFSVQQIENNTTFYSDKEGIIFASGSWSETLKKAKESGKLIFVDAYAEWCPPCKRMASTVFPQAEVATLYNKNFINYKMDCEKGDGPSFLRKYAIKAYPTLLFIDGDGNVFKRVVGGQNTEQFISIGQEVVKNSAMAKDKK